jgi:hypothetical protein
MTEIARPSVETCNGCVLIRVPMKLKRRGGRKEVTVPEGLDHRPAPTPRAESRMAVALARALRWQEALESGAFPSMKALAQKLGVDGRYVARLLDLTLLAPDIIEGVLNGTEPDRLSLEKLFRAPMEWEEQRQGLGFPGRSSAEIGP